MPTRPETLQFLLDQLAGLPGVRVSKTFGEYCLYVDGRSVGFVCNDQLFLKPTECGRAALGAPVLGRPYHWVRTPHFLVSADRWDDREALCAVVTATASALPRHRPPRPRQARPPAR